MLVEGRNDVGGARPQKAYPISVSLIFRGTSFEKGYGPAISTNSILPSRRGGPFFLNRLLVLCVSAAKGATVQSWIRDVVGNYKQGGSMTNRYGWYVRW